MALFSKADSAEAVITKVEYHAIVKDQPLPVQKKRVAALAVTLFCRAKQGAFLEQAPCPGCLY